MTPEWNPDMEELNKRRVERHLRRQKMNAQKRRKKQFAMIGVCLLLVAVGLGVFFLLRMGEDREPEPQLSVQSDGSVKDEDDTVIHLVAAGDVNVTDATGITCICTIENVYGSDCVILDITSVPCGTYHIYITLDDGTTYYGEVTIE